jgi:hypothetical protein
MGFFDLFKKKEMEKVKKMENLEFTELDFWVENKTAELSKDKDFFTESIKTRMVQLDNEFDLGINGLEGIDWEKIKADERVKGIVMENLNIYISHLKQLKLDLKEVNEIERKEIDKIFTGFDKKTVKSYQKSTFLIGKELAVISESAGNFFRDLDKLQEENKELLENFRIISEIKGRLEEFSKTDELIFRVKKEIGKINGRIEIAKLKIKENNKEIEKIMDSQEFKKWKTNNEKYICIKDNKKKMLVELKSLIDLKLLAKIWHENEKEMIVVKKYRENFERAFEEDGGKILNKIVGTLDNEALIKEKIGCVLDLDLEIEESIVAESLTSGLEEDIKRIEVEIDELEVNKARTEKRISKLECVRGKIREVLNEELEKVGVEIR